MQHKCCSTAAMQCSWRATELKTELLLGRSTRVRCEVDRNTYVLRNHCHPQGKHTKINFFQESIFPQKSRHINAIFKVSVQQSFILCRHLLLTDLHILQKKHSERMRPYHSNIWVCSVPIQGGLGITTHSVEGAELICTMKLSTHPWRCDFKKCY